MSEFLQLVFLLSVILVAAKLAGYLSLRLGQPAVLGELLVGVLIGPAALNLPGLLSLTSLVTDAINLLADLGVLLLMFIAGLELEFHELSRDLAVAGLAGTVGVILPVGLGWGVGLAFGLSSDSAIFLGLILGATSVSISAQTLMELRVLRSRVGLGLLGAAVFDDVLVILLLSVFLALHDGAAGWLELTWILLRMLLFLAASYLFGRWVLPRVAQWAEELPISQGLLALGLVVAMVYALAAELLGGIAAITGAFLAGVMFGRSPSGERLLERVSALAYGLFVPVFFVNIGLSIETSNFTLGLLWLTLAVIATAVLAKWIGAGLGARLGGLSWRESVRLGAGMISRGEVGLIVASQGLRLELIGPAEFSAVVAVVLVSTLITPPLLRALYPRSPQEVR